MTRALRGLAALTLLLAAPAAAQNPIADRMLNLLGKERPEDASPCKLNGGGPNVTGATTRFSTALSTPVADNKRRMLVEGRDLTLSAIQNGQAGSSKAWYYLARTYLQAGDLAGADSAFGHLLALAPACAAEITMYRTRGWSMMMNAVVAARNAHQTDSTLFFARAANQIAPDHPQGWYTIAAGYMDANQGDSARAYYTRAMNAPTDSTPAAMNIRQASAFQVGVIAFNQRDFPGAVAGFSAALRMKADDGDAKRNLVAALRQAGMTDSASKVEASMMSATAGSAAGLSVGQLFDRGVAQFNAHDYAAAAVTFEKILEAEPYNHDALVNLANAYLGVQNGDKLLENALKLQAIEPLSFEATQLVANGYRLKHDQPNVVKSATALGGQTVNLAAGSSAFATTATGATLTLTATGRDARDMNDRPIRAAAIPIVVEFIDNAGTVIASAEATVPALAANATQPIAVTGTGAGITGWRYHRK